MSAEKYLKAAEQGDAEAQYNLCKCYDGKGDYNEAVKWLRKAAEQGLAKAQHSLGFRYSQGIKVPQDYTEAAKWYLKAAQQGDAAGQHNMGVCFANGHGVPKDNVAAYSWFILSAAQGIDLAKSNIDDIVENMTNDEIEEAQDLCYQWLVQAGFPFEISWLLIRPSHPEQVRL